MANRPSIATALLALPEHPTIDDRFAAVAKAVPAFGGAYIDEATDTLKVLMTDRSLQSATQAKSALVELMGKVADRSHMQVLPATYSFTQLKTWHDRLSPRALALPGAVLTGIDDATNRITVGVEELEAQQASVEAELARQDIPREAVYINEVSPIKFSATLRDRRRPVVGGIQLVWIDSFGTLGFICTTGFVATRAGTLGFVTNSHCTQSFGAVDSGSFWQHDVITVDEVIGEETVNPPTFTGSGCPSGRVCRTSDASFATALSSPTAPFNQGFIARPAVNTINWNQTDTFRIIGEAIPMMGQGVTKTGRTTGRTIGTIGDPCINVNANGTNITLLCQSMINGITSAEGDSGSPVTTVVSGNDVHLVGIFWGASGTTGFFSGIDFVQNEIGTLNTCASGFSC